MNIRTTLTKAAAASALMFVMAGAASAQNVVIANAGANPSNTTNYVSYTEGVGFSINTSNAFLNGRQGQGVNNNVTISFPTIPDLNTGTFSGPSSPFTEDLGAGSFLITDSATNATLLSGTFQSATLAGTFGQSSGSLTLASPLAYGPGSFFPAGFAPTGTLAVEFNSSTPFAQDPITNGPQSFVGTDQITFSAPRAVPEPGTVASFAMGGFGLLGLMVRARKTRRSSGIA